MKSRINKLIKTVSLALIPILLTGCWDYTNLEFRGYVLGVSIDNVNTITPSEMETMPTESGVPKYSFGIQIPIMARAQTRPSGQSGGSTPGMLRTWNLRFNARSYFEVNREFATRLDYTTHHSHLQSIIISEAVAREGIVEPLDFFLREPAVRVRTKVYVTPSEAFPLFQVIPKIDDYSANYLRGITDRGEGRTARMVTETDLGQVSKAFHSGRAFVLPRIIYDKEEIKNAGAAIFKGGKMIGWLDELNLAYAKYIRNDAKGGSFVIDYPLAKDKKLAFEIIEIKTEITPIVKDDEIKFKLELKTTVKLVERSYPVIDDHLSTSSIKELGKLLEKHIEKNMKNTVKYVQDEYEVDIFKFYDVLSRKEPKIWDKVKKKWDEETFSSVQVETSAKVTIRHIGSIK